MRLDITLDIGTAVQDSGAKPHVTAAASGRSLTVKRAKTASA
jgi:hypothetical protein